MVSGAEPGRGNVILSGAEGEVHTRKPLIVWLALIALAITWGSSFILMKKGLEVFTPQQVAALRVFIGALALMPFLFRVQRTDWQRVKLKYIAVVALVGSAIPALLFTVAETRISSSMAGILNCLTPLFIMLVGYAIFRTPIRTVQMAGLLLGFMGAATMILGQPTDGGTGSNNLYTLLIVAACLCYGISANTVKWKLTGARSISIAAIGFAMVGPLAGLYLWHTGLFTLIATNPQALHAMGYMLILGALGTGYANFVYYFLVQRASPLFAGVVTYLMPIVAVGWGLLALEPIGPLHLFGMALILLGIWLTSK